MQLNLSKDDLHHAYMIVGDPETIFSALEAFCTDTLGIATRGNPDYFSLETETLGIDDARNIRKAQERRALMSRQIFVISVREITREAQNALLKIFEEPTEGTHFFVILPSAENVLPTLLSRVELFFLADNDTASESMISPADFLQASAPQRLDLLSPMISQNNRESARRFLDMIEVYFYKELGVRGMSNVFDRIDTAKKYISSRGVSLKIVLQQLALTLPQEVGK